MKTKLKSKAKKRQYVIVRTLSAGCHAGVLERRVGQEVTLTNARRLWYWKGAASLSELATRGSSCPGECRFPAPVPRIVLTQATEVIDVTDAARASIEGVPVWTA